MRPDARSWALLVLGLAWTIAGCAEPDARGQQAPSPRWGTQAKRLDAAKFVVLVVQAGPKGLELQRAAGGDLDALRPRERSRTLGEPAPERQEHGLCAQLIHEGTDTGSGRCVPWRPPHAAP